MSRWIGGEPLRSRDSPNLGASWRDGSGATDTRNRHAFRWIECARGQSEVPVATSLAQFVQFVQPDRIVTGPELPPVPASSMPLSRSHDGSWQYTNPNPPDDRESAPVRLTTLRSLRSRATAVTDQQVGRPCPRAFDVVSVIAQKQPDGSTNHFPAPSHVRFEEAHDPITLPAAVLDRAE